MSVSLHELSEPLYEIVKLEYTRGKYWKEHQPEIYNSASGLIRLEHQRMALQSFRD